jgi:predicted metal-dependent phosphoesterase TrpH
MVDLHLHTTASDGTLSPARLVEASKHAGLTTISITDHDTTAGIPEGQNAAADLGLELVPGLEISTVADGRDLHLLGYFIDPASRVLREFLERQRQERARRIVVMADRLAALGCPIDAESVLAAAAHGRSVGRPQLAAALVNAGYVRTPDEAFQRFLEYGGPAYEPRRGASPQDAIQIVHQAGGLASLAHPGPSRRDELIPVLAAAGLDAIEARHPDHTADVEARYRAIASELRLLTTGGSDFHGETGHRAPAPGTVTLTLEEFASLRAARARR